MGAKTLIVPADGAGLARQAASPETVLIESRIDGGGQIRFSTSGSLKTRSELAAAIPEDVALVLHTSGTTSRPKRVRLRGCSFCFVRRRTHRY